MMADRVLTLNKPSPKFSSFALIIAPTALTQNYKQTNSLGAQLAASPDTLVNVVNGYFQNALGVGFTQATVPNPAFWAVCVNAYIELLRQNPQLATTNLINQQTDVAQMLAQGQGLQSALANITFTNGNGGSKGVNWPLWNAAFGSIPTI